MVHAALPVLLAAAVSALAADAGGTRASPPTSGSQLVLERLWTASALQGTPADRAVRRLRPADHAPPAGLTTLPLPAPPLPSVAGRVVRRVQPAGGDKVVALSFDLCEQADEIAGYDRDIVNHLRAERVGATFFAGGKWMKSHPETAMQLIADPLFEIGNHAWTHGNLRVLSGQALRDQITWTQAEYEILHAELAARARARGIGEDEIGRIPGRITGFRFPYGTCGAEALAAVAESGLTAIQWDVVSGDADRRATAAGIVEGVLTRVRPGSIVVFHANGRGGRTAEALARIIPGLRRQGFRFVTVGELLTLGRPVTADTCYELRPGDNRRYDRLFGRGTE